MNRHTTQETRAWFERLATSNRHWTIIAVLCSSFLLARWCEAADPPSPQASATELGLRLPAATPQVISNRRVLVPCEGKDPTVASVYLSVGDHYVVILPDGSMISVPTSEVTETDRPFVPLDKKELANQLTAQRFPGFATRSTKRYLYIYNASEAFVSGTSKILESMYLPLFNYCKRAGLPTHDPEFPLVVIIFRTQEEFQAYRQVPESMVAYYNGLSNHVIMFEQSKLAELAPELAIKQAVSTVAHEGVHQVLHNIGVQQRLSNWPVWFSEGLAEYFAPTEVDRRVRWKGVGLVNDLRLYELSEYYRARKGEMTDGDLVRRVVETPTLDSLGYATSWALFHYWARTHRDQFRACLIDASQLRPLEEVRASDLFAKHFSRDYVGVERDLVGYLQSLPYVDPVENQTHFVLFALNGSSREVVVTPSPHQIMKAQRAKSQANLRVQAFPSRTAAEAYANAWLKQ